MKHLTIFTAFIIFSTISTYACDCECPDDCSFNVISNTHNFVALVKVISYDDYLEHEIIGYDDRMPYSMTVEIIKKYKGSESKKTIKIWGDNGMLCRPYIVHFKIGEFYLIAPRMLGDYKMEIESPNDYDFFSCSTDFLKVDMDKEVALGEYSKEKNEIKLSDFEHRLVK